METKQKLEEVRDILAAFLDSPRCPATIVRAHRLVDSAIADFFDSEDDVASIPLWFPDNDFPAA